MNRVNQASRPAARALIPSAVAAVVQAETLMLAPLLLVVLVQVVAKRRVEAVVAAALSLGLPLAIGMATMLGIALLVERRRPRWTLELVGSAFAVGLLVLVAATEVMSLFGWFSVATLAQTSVAIPAVAWVASLVGGWRRGRQTRMQPDERRLGARSVANLVAASVVVAFGFGLALYYRTGSPLPLHPAWDAFAHLRVVDGLLAGHWSPWTTDYSTTFRVNAYLPTHHLLIAAGSLLGHAAPLAVYWAGPFVVFPVLGVLAYLVARRFGAAPAAAVIGGVVAILVGFPLQAAAFLGLAPSTLALLFVPFIIRVVGDHRSPPEVRATRLGLLVLGAMVAHFAIGVTILALTVAMLGARIVLARVRWAPVALVGAAILITGLSAVLYTGLVRLPGRPPLALSTSELDTGGEHELTRARSLYVRQRDLQKRVSAFVFLGSSLGVVLLAARPRRRRRSDDWFAATSIAALVGMFLPIVGADRAFIFLPFILGPPLSVLAGSGLDLALRPGPALGERGLGGGAVLTAFVLFAVAPSMSFVDFQRDQTKAAAALSSFGDQELKAGLDLQTATPPDVLLVSDPISQEFIGGLANRESFGGGPYASDQQLASVRAAFLAGSPAAAWAGFQSLAAGTTEPDRVIVVLEGRTARWLVAPAGSWIGYYDQLPPYLDTPSIAQAASNLEDGTYFVRLWVSRDVRIYAARPGPNAPVPWLSPTGSAP